MAVRTTDSGVTSHRRLVTRTMVSALKSVFDANYPREPQLRNLKVTTTFPLKKIDYPSVVVEYQPQRVVNAGVGHEEWFGDENLVMRKWNHSRFEGTVDLSVFTLSPLDRDLLADAVMEVIRFGRLDDALLPFFDTIYGGADDPVRLMFSQIMLNADEIDFGGDSASLAPWSPEDLLVYETTLSTMIHGGFYNTKPVNTYGYVTRASAEPYPQGEQDVAILFGGEEKADVLPFANLATPWTNPFEHKDEAVVFGKSVFPRFEGDEYVSPMIDAGMVTGAAVISGVEDRFSLDSATIVGHATISSAPADSASLGDTTIAVGIASVSAVDESQTFALTTTGAQ